MACLNRAYQLFTVEKVDFRIGSNIDFLTSNLGSEIGEVVDLRVDVSNS